MRSSGGCTIPTRVTKGPDYQVLGREVRIYMQDKLARIKTIGFTLAGRWKRSGNGITFELDKNLAIARNVLYAFAVDDELMYLSRQDLKTVWFASWSRPGMAARKSHRNSRLSRPSTSVMVRRNDNPIVRS